MIPWSLRIAVPLMLAVVLWGWGYSVGGARVQRKADIALAEQAGKALVTERNLRTDLEAIDELRHEELAAVAVERDRALAGLRDRRARLSEAQRAACAGSSGAELSKPDSEFLVREAERADRAVSELRTCEARERRTYEALK